VKEVLWGMVEEDDVQVVEEGVEEESTKQVLSASSATSWDTIRMSVPYGKKMPTLLSLKMVNYFLWLNLH
jgi:hypothetical protein